MDCIFCQIIAGKIPGEIVYQDDKVVAFRDIHPVAPTHILIVPRKHIFSTDELTEADEPLAGHMMIVAAKLAAKEGLKERGYRLVINAGEYGGQLVPHLHLHLIGGKKLSFQLGR